MLEPQITADGRWPRRIRYVASCRRIDPVFESMSASRFAINSRSRDVPRGTYMRRGAARRQTNAQNLERAVVKLSGILGATVTLLMLTLVAQTQGVGDPQRGAQVFVQCKVCHSLEAGKNMVGPSLHGLIGRKAGSVPGGIVTATVSSTYREPRLALSHAAATASRHSAVASARKIRSVDREMRWR